MSNFFTCYLWWLILGVFIGLIFCWVYDFIFRRDRGLPAQPKPLPMRPFTRIIDHSAGKSASKATAAAKSASTPSAARSQQSAPATTPASSTSKGDASSGENPKDHGFKLRKMPDGVDDLTVIEGIGPKICQLMIDDGITSFQLLAEASQDRLAAILEKAGPRFRLAKPDTWPQQADLAARGEWKALKALQDRLDGGVEPGK